MTRATHNGTCQVCGREQAVNPKTGHLAKHGYTVEHGYFQGTCPGAHAAPLQTDKTIANKAVSELNAEADRLDAMAAGEIEVDGFSIRVGGHTLRGEKARPVFVTRKNFDELLAEHGRSFRMYSIATWSDLEGRARRSAPLTAKNYRRTATEIAERAEKIHGTDLIERK